MENDSEFTLEDNVLKGKVVPYHEEHTSVGEFILRRLESNPDLVGQIDAVSGEEFTYRTMRERSVRCALWLQSQGLRSGDFVAICSNDHLDYSSVCFAILYLGAIPTPWDTRSNEEGFIRQMNITKPKVVFTMDRCVAALSEAAKKAKLDLKIIVFGHVPGFFEFDSVIVEPETDRVQEFDCVSIKSSEETAFIIFTSGTTGTPRAVALSHKALMMLSHQAKALCMPGNVCLSYTTPEWIISIESLLMYLLLNIPRLILSPFEVHAMCAAIQKYKVTWAYVEPSLINKLLQSDALGRYDLSSLTHVFYTGNILAIDAYQALKEHLPQVQITSGYGSTESCGYISIQSRKSVPGSCGNVTANAQLKVIDPDTGRTLGANEKGELLLKFACMMNHYLNDPQATSEVLDEDGWLHSGDLGYYDDNGEIFVINRLKDTIYIGDYDISPFEIEAVICSHPGIEDAAVVGQTRPLEDDVLIAFAVRAKDFSDTSKQVTEKDIVDLVAAKLPESHWLRAGVRFIDRIPRTPSNKIRRAVLRDLAESMAIS